MYADISLVIFKNMIDYSISERKPYYCTNCLCSLKQSNFHIINLTLNSQMHTIQFWGKFPSLIESTLYYFQGFIHTALRLTIALSCRFEECTFPPFFLAIMSFTRLRLMGKKYHQQRKDLLTKVESLYKRRKVFGKG